MSAVLKLLILSDLLSTLKYSFFAPAALKRSVSVSFKFDKCLLLKQKLHSDVPCFM